MVGRFAAHFRYLVSIRYLVNLPYFQITSIQCKLFRIIFVFTKQELKITDKYLIYIMESRTLKRCLTIGPYTKNARNYYETIHVKDFGPSGKSSLDLLVDALLLHRYATEVPISI